MEPVVSSKYGKRPLLEVPALQVESGNRVEVSSLQPRPQPHFDDSPTFIYRSDGLNQQQPQPLAAHTQQPAVGLPLQQPPVAAPLQQPALGVAVQQPALASHAGLGVRPAAPPAALPAALPQAPAVPGSLYAPPPGHLSYLPQQPLVSPMGLQPQPQPQQFVDSGGNIIPAPSPYPVHLPPQQPYPGVHNPYHAHSQGYYAPGGLAPPGVMPQYLLPIHPRTPSEDNFRLEGVLEYGRLTTVHFRDKTSNFRGLPDFLRRELQKSYGHFPATDIRIIAQAGEFHIYANPRGEEDEFVDGAGTGSHARMIGFNEVRGEPR